MTTVSKIVNYASSEYILYQMQVVSPSVFSALINGDPTATSVIYDNDTNEGMFGRVNYMPLGFGHIMLYNKTRGNYRKIDNVDPGTNRITTISSTDDWANNDEITTANPVVGEAWPASNYFLLDLSEEVPAAATFILATVALRDTTTLPALKLHPAATYITSKRMQYYAQVTSVYYSEFIILPVSNQQIAMSHWSGYTSGLVQMQIYGYVMEETMATAAEVADAVWDELISGHVGAGSFGAKNQKVVPSETVGDYKATGFSTHNAAAIWAAANRALSTPNDYKADVSALALEATSGAIKAKTDIIPADLADVPTATELNTDHSSGSWAGATAEDIDTELSGSHGDGSWEGSPAADVADAVWDEKHADHQTEGSFGRFMKRIHISVDDVIALILSGLRR